MPKTTPKFVLPSESSFIWKDEKNGFSIHSKKKVPVLGIKWGGDFSLPNSPLADEVIGDIDLTDSLPLRAYNHLAPLPQGTPLSSASAKSHARALKANATHLEDLIQSLLQHYGELIIHHWNTHLDFEINLSGNPQAHQTGLLKNWKTKLQSIPHLSDAEILWEIPKSASTHKPEWISQDLWDHPQVVIIQSVFAPTFFSPDSGKVYPKVLRSLRSQLTSKALELGLKPFKKLGFNKKSDFLPHLASQNIRKIDLALFNDTKGFELLNSISPINLQGERKKFLKQEAQYEPQFNYRPLQIDPFLIKRKLYNLPIEKIRDIHFFHLFESVIRDRSDTLDLLHSIGKPEFLLHSIRQFGSPNEDEIKVARYLLSLPEIADNSERLQGPALLQRFQSEIDQYDLGIKVKPSKNLLPKAVYNPKLNAVRCQPQLELSYIETLALVHHEVGVHALTTYNARQQPLYLLRKGLPLDVKTQEGLALLGEYLSGNLTLRRLKILALRTLAIHSIVQGKSFVETYHNLNPISPLNPSELFDVLARVWRGGGFTKDHVYLKGFLQMFKLFKSGHDLSLLFAGKTAIEFLPVLRELEQRELVLKPSRLPSFLEKQPELNPLIEYALSGIENG